MTVYTFSEARQKLAALLERARKEGGVRVKRRDGQVFVIRPERPKRSPLDVDGVHVDISAREIVGIVRHIRQRTSVTSRPANQRMQRTPQKRRR